jgi:hypothetical protein
MFNTHNSFLRDTSAVRNGQRERNHGPIERTPDVYDADSVFEKRRSFVREMVVYALQS